MRPRAKIKLLGPIDIGSTLYEKSIGTKTNDLDVCLEVVSTYQCHSIRNPSGARSSAGRL